MLGENQGKKRGDLEKGYYNWEWKRKHVEKMRWLVVKHHKKGKKKRTGCKSIPKMQKSSSREKNIICYMKKISYFSFRRR